MRFLQDINHNVKIFLIHGSMRKTQQQTIPLTFIKPFVEFKCNIKIDFDVFKASGDTRRSFIIDVGNYTFGGLLIMNVENMVMNFGIHRKKDYSL